MARHICPSCGSRYNGKRCANCLYENFAEEYSHGSHTHTGEPLVIRGPVRRPIPRKDPFGCEERTRKSRPASVRAVYIILILLLLIWAATGIVEHFASSRRVTIHWPEAPAPEAAAPAVEIPSGGIMLYDDGALRIAADWEETRKYEDGIRVVVENHTQLDLNVVARDILVNDYVMEDSSLYIPVEAGHTAEGWLYLDSSDLERAGITDVQWVFASFEAYDTESYETVAESESVALCTTGVLTQERSDSGEVLFDQDGIRLICKGYLPSDYDPEVFSKGSLLFYLENKTDVTVDCFTDEVTVNGQETSLTLWCSLPPNTQAVRRMYLFGLSDEHLNIRTREDVTEMLASFMIDIQDESGATLTTDPLSIPFQLDWTK